VPAVIHLSSPLPTITGDLTIDGDPIGDTLSGGGSVGIMSVAPGANVHLDSLNFAAGGSLSTFGGGAIFNQGALAISHCTFSDNAAQEGGTILNNGQLNISGSTFSGSQVVNPTKAPTLSAGAGGHFSGGTYTYEYTWVSPAGETAASPASAQIAV